MNVLLIILAIVAALFLTFVLLKKRKKKRAVFLSNQKHPNGFLKYHKQTKLRIKPPLKESKKDEVKNIVFFRFKGDIKASQKNSLSRIIDEIILNKEEILSALILVDSPGGSVTDYGQCYSEIKRLRQAGINLEVCIDNVAASGGYLMSLSANKIYAAPFAMIGSIGVVSFIPNIRPLLERFDIKPRTYTSGKFKRTVSLTDEATPEEVAHYQQQLALIHDQFKQALKEFRPNVDLGKVATGEAWLASTSLEMKLDLVDEIKCSSEHLLDLNQSANLIEILEETKESGLKKWIKLQSEALLERISAHF